MSDELLPCPNPWCDSHDIEDGGPRAPEDIWSIEDTITERYRVQCAYCYMKGPGANSEDEAIAAWNTRTLPAAITAEAALLKAIEVTQPHQMAWLREDMAKRLAVHFAAQRIEARSDETLQAAQPERREPDPVGDAP